ncbi:MAG: FadR family transcriptional regulator [Betaproteobacteria bacterium]|nr:MAG: FadR family transcriptional regulator [Betaproteobacteria bacterium]
MARPLDHSPWNGKIRENIGGRLEESEGGRGLGPAPGHGGSHLPLQAVEPRRLYRQIADQIAQLIASGEFPPGARLPAERELATSLGVSRASVREAIISLEMGGLVEVRVGTGIFVTAPAAQSAVVRDAGPGPFELLQARKLIEGEIAAVAASMAAQPALDYLRQCVLRMEAHVDDFVAREASDREFHLGIAKATGNGSLELVVEGLWDQRAELWGRLQRHFHTPELARKTIRDHAAILNAIAARDPKGARAAMHRHLARVVREFQRGLDDRGHATQQRRASAPAATVRSARPRS